MSRTAWADFDVRMGVSPPKALKTTPFCGITSGERPLATLASRSHPRGSHPSHREASGEAPGPPAGRSPLWGLLKGADYRPGAGPTSRSVAVRVRSNTRYVLDRTR